MTPQPATSSTTQARNGRHSGTRAARGAGVRRRALVAALGMAVLAAVVPVTAAHADELPDLPDFPGDLANPIENPSRRPRPWTTPAPPATRSRPRSASTPGSAGWPPGPTRPPASP